MNEQENDGGVVESMGRLLHGNGWANQQERIAAQTKRSQRIAGFGAVAGVLLVLLVLALLAAGVVWVWQQVI